MDEPARRIEVDAIAERHLDPPPFAFLIGSERSGTTVLRAMVTGNSQIAIPGESYFITELARRHHRPQGRFDLARFATDLEGHFWYRQWGLSDAELASALAADPPTDYPEAIRRVYGAYARRHRAQRYGDKTPRYTMYTGRLARMFPEARFVHLIRDGRDVAMALIARHDERPNTVGEAALFWRMRIWAGRRAAATLGERYLEVHYENLVADPEQTLRRVCEHLRLEFEPAMLDHTPIARAMLAGVHAPENHLSALGPLTPGLRDWRSQMSKADVVLFESLASGCLQACGYELSGIRRPSIGRGARRRLTRTYVDYGLAYARFGATLAEHRIRERMCSTNVTSRPESTFEATQAP